jgi:3-phenylpropionate/cinnamic acid dioxygenase small subunit
MPQNTSTLSLQDRAEIDDLLARYAFALDLREWHDPRSVFSEDAEIDYSKVRVAGESFSRGRQERSAYGEHAGDLTWDRC